MLTIVNLKGCYHVRSEESFVKVTRANVVQALVDAKLYVNGIGLDRKTKAQLLRYWTFNAPSDKE